MTQLQNSLAFQPVDLTPKLGLETDISKYFTKDNNYLGKPGNVSNGFFSKGNSTMDSIGEGVGLAGGVLSLADMLNNWGMQKDAMKLNMANVRQQMGNNQEAFDRSKARQDQTSAEVQRVHDSSLAFYQNGG